MTEEERRQLRLTAASLALEAFTKSRWIDDAGKSIGWLTLAREMYDFVTEKEEEPTT